jgi:hypothetical protein
MNTRMWIILALLVGAGMAGCDRGPSELVEGRYIGYLADGDMENHISLETENSKLVVDLYAEEGVQKADINFHGAVKINIIGFDIMFYGPQSDTIGNVWTNGVDLECTYKTTWAHFPTSGEFDNDQYILYLDVKKLGKIPLELVEEE